jgi:hypothetical protein
VKTNRLGANLSHLYSRLTELILDILMPERLISGVPSLERTGTRTNIVVHIIAMITRRLVKQWRFYRLISTGSSSVERSIAHWSHLVFAAGLATNTADAECPEDCRTCAECECKPVDRHHRCSYLGMYAIWFQRAVECTNKDGVYDGRGEGGDEGEYCGRLVEKVNDAVGPRV